MRKLFRPRIEVVTGAVAAAALVGGLAFYGAPSVNIAQAADALRSGAQAIVGDSSAEAKGESCPMQRAFAQAKGLCPLGGPACDGDKDKDKSAGFQLAANLNPACDGDKGCDKDKAGFQTAANLTPACDGDCRRRCGRPGGKHPPRLRRRQGQGQGGRVRRASRERHASLRR